MSISKCHLVCLSGLFALCTACGEDAKTTEPIVIIEDRPDQDVQDMSAPDQDAPDQDSPDMAQDMDPVVAAEPEGNVFLRDPTTNMNQTAVVKLPRPNNEAGALSNEATTVYNCLNEPGEELRFQGFVIGNLCKQVQVARPGADGHYLQHVPPADYTDPNDVFAEVQMYYHVNIIRDYIVNVLGDTSLSEAIDALTNLQIYTNETAAGFLGRQAGWFPFDNAAFFFPDAFQQIGLPPRERGAIVFGQGERVDFSYDATVIYHEFTHAMIGDKRFIGAFPDMVGLNNTPGAVNEGLADYVATSLMNQPVVGLYGLAAFGPGFVRDLSIKRACPADLTTAIHDDGKIVGSALWSIRQQLGKDITDRLVMRVIASANQATGFDQFGALLQAEADREGAQVGATVRMVLAEHGLNGCNRAREWANWTATTVPITQPGPQELGPNAFSGGAPGYMQFFLNPPEDGKVAVLTWSMQAGQPGGFGGGSARLQLAIRQAQPVSLNVGFNRVTIVEDLRVNPAVTTQQGLQRQTVTLGADCFAPGQRTYLMFVNTGVGANVVRTNIQYVDASTAQNVQSCAAAP